MPKGIPKKGINKGWFQKGKSSWNKGKHIKLNDALEVWKEKGGKSPWLGKHRSKTTKIAISKAFKGKTYNEIGRDVSPLIGRTLSKDCIEKMSKTHSGKNHYNWQGGKSFEPYGLKFNKELKEQIRKRDNFTCQECRYTETQLGYRLSCHHIDYDKQNNNPNNLISLCRNCHMQTNFKRVNWTNYFRTKVSNVDNIDLAKFELQRSIK